MEGVQKGMSAQKIYRNSLNYSNRHGAKKRPYAQESSSWPLKRSIISSSRSSLRLQKLLNYKFLPLKAIYF